jgi:tetratricopeptide (TPR) repeat protein/tRNA A-37 threonylcarbamoyl transferase component Bud32
MSEPTNENVTVDLSSAGLGDALRRQFEAAWQEALQGGAPPQIEAYLRQIPGPQRLALFGELQQIDQDYQQRQLRQSDPTAVIPDLADQTCTEQPAPGDPSPPAAPPPGDVGAAQDPGSMLAQVLSATVAPPEPPPAACNATLDYPTGQPPVSGPTLTPGEGAPAAPEDGAFELTSGADRPAAGVEAVVAGYEILSELGRGGMGVVYKARQVSLKRIVALKMVLAGGHAGAQQLARFYTEAEAVAQLQHPNIVQIFEVGEHEGLPFFSLEFVDGGSLAQKIAGKPQPPREAAETVQLLALAMAMAHQAGVIHRDLKPANVLLTDDGLPKITDFGLAKRLEGDSAQTKSGTLMGTPSYMAPEQARGDTHQIGPLADLYALGAILYELLTGRPPFVGTTLLETLEQVRSQEPVPPRRLQPKVPRDLETVCLKCLQKEPGQRYANCEDLADDLRRFLEHRPIQARPVGRTERLWRWCKRNPRVAGLSAAVGLLFVIVAATLGVLVVRAGREREAVAESRKVAGERLEQAAEVVAAGNYQRAHDLLQLSDPLLDRHPDLEDVRARFRRLQAQVDVYAEFKTLLDNARFTCWFGSRDQKKQGQEYCRQLLALSDDIEHEKGKGAHGLPPLSPQQRRLFQEDVFEAFLVAAFVEQELAAGTSAATQLKATRQALAYFNRAEKVLPGTRALYVNRAACWGKLGNKKADRADMARARAIPPTSAVDRFWHAYADHLRGDQALGKGDVKGAHAFYRKELASYAAFLQLRPDRFWGYFNWAVCHSRLGDPADLHDALVGFTASIRLRPDYAWPYNNRGTVHLRLGQLDLAVADYTAALARNDRYAEAYANRGLARLKQGKADLALEDLGRAVRADPGYAPAYAERAEVYRSRKRFAEAVRDYTRLIELSADKGPLYLKRAEAHRQMNRLDEAIGDYDRAIALNAKNALAYFNRARLHAAARHFLQARDDYSAVLRLVPRAVSVYQDRAELNWLALKDFDAAVADWEQVARLLPKNPLPHRCIGEIELGRRQYGRALQALQQALERKADYTEALWAKAQVYRCQGQLKEALAVIQPAAEHLPADKPETLNIRGDIYRALGRLDDAAKDYRRLIGLRPKAPDAYVSLALVYTKQGKPEEARKCFERLVQAAPDVSRSYLCRAEFRRNRGEFQAALADCAEAARKDPGSALPPLVRASVEAARGRPERAVADAERALKKAPPNDGRVLYAAACVWSLASQKAAADKAKPYADGAADFLAGAVGKGFHDLIYPEHNRMADDPALAPLRQHPRARDLLAHRP